MENRFVIDPLMRRQRYMDVPVLHGQSGMTLIELLVSLVILGFVVSIMSGAFFQVAQVVRIAENVNGQFQPQWVRLHALTDLVGNLVIQDVEHPFEGNSVGFSGYSLSLPQADWGHVQQFQTKLESNPQGGTDLILISGSEKPLVIASWTVPVKLEYLATDGSNQSMWPAFGKVVNEMPAGVVVRASSGEQLVQMIAPYAGARKPEPDAKTDMGKLFGLDIK
ncbi:type II secretion system protein [Undibacterium sp. Ren11W]|uniref:type II secretion system protein n=1 Tax=Undibacterium sp. Ren11W TaxID=3413045 RepID=UPI003BEF7E90